MKFTIWLAYECNLNCTYCYEGNSKNSGIMTQDVATDVLNFMYNQIITLTHKDDFAIVEFFGGEPLINYEVMCYMIEAIKAWDIKIPVNFWITTNAVLLNKERIEYILQTIKSVSVSIDGVEYVNDKHRKFHNGSGSYSSIILNIKELLLQNNEQKAIRGRMTVTPDTVSYLYESVSFLIGLGFKMIVPVMDYFSHWTDKDIELLYEEMVKIYENITSKRDDLYLGLVDDVSLRLDTICLGGETTMNITPEGSIYPCSYVVGMKEFDFGDVWKGINKQKIEWFRNVNKSEMNESCLKCSWMERCTGNKCRLLNYVTTGDFDTPSAAMCANEHLQIRFYKNFYLKQEMDMKDDKRRD